VSTGKDTPAPALEDPLASLSPSDDEQLEEINERYEITAKLGQGGMGRVFRAHDKILARDVAIKLLNRELKDDVFVLRFQQEARAASQLNHPNILCVLDFGLISASQPYMVMEWVNGENLDERLDNKNNPLTVADKIEILMQITRGLQHAHRNGIVHRDIKPSNVMLTESEQGRKALILDFGIAKIEDPRADGMLTVTGQIIGSPRYISPEQARGEPLDGRSDIYSLGCVMFEMLTGKPPFQGDSALATISMHMEEPAPKLREALPGSSELLESIICKAMEKHAERRFRSMEEFHDALSAWEDENPAEPESITVVTTQPIDTTLSTRQKWVRITVFACIATTLGCVGYTAYLNHVCAVEDEQAKKDLLKAKSKPDNAQNAQATVTPQAVKQPPRPIAPPPTSLTEIAPEDFNVDRFFNSAYTRTRKLNLNQYITVNQTTIAQDAKKLKRELSTHPDVIHIKLYDITMTPEMVSVIEDAPNIKELRFQNVGLSEALQVRLFSLERLELLKFVEMPVSVKALKLLPRLKKMQDFQIYSSKLSPLAFNEIAKVKSLQVLELLDCGSFSHDTLFKLQALKGLHSLQLRKSGIKDEDLKWISTLPELETLSLAHNGPFTSVGLKNLSAMRNLKNLWLEDTGLDNRCMLAIAKAKLPLEMLDVSKNPLVGIGGLQHFYGQTDVKIVVAQTAIDPKQLNALKVQMGGLKLGTARNTLSGKAAEVAEEFSEALD